MNQPIPADKTPQNWIDYWSGDDFWKDSPIWRINAGLFFRRVNRIVEFRKDDSVLNIGCGLGYLETLLSPVVKDILAVDVSDQFVELCRRNCRDCDNVQVVPLGTDYTDLSVGRKKFSLMLAVSVVQYYRNMQEVESLIASARDIASPGARMLIADLPLERSAPGFVWDGMCSLCLAIREGYFRLLLRTAYSRWARSSLYKNFHDQNRELTFSRSGLESLIRRMGLQAVIVQKNLSIYANRPSLLIQF